MTVRLTGDDDALADDDESSRAIDVSAALPVLLVDGEPGVRASVERDRLSASGPRPERRRHNRRADTRRDGDAFGPDDLTGQRVVVLANVERLEPLQVTSIAKFLEAGGGVLIAPGDRIDVAFANATLYHEGGGWLPAKIGDQPRRSRSP